MVRFVELDWTDWSIDHVARHGLTSREVDEVVENQRFLMRRLRDRRYMIIGQTAAGRYVTIIVDREWDSEYVVVTARPASPDERRRYLRHINRR